MTEGVIYSSHRGQEVALGRPKRSPQVGGQQLVKASRLFDALPAPARARDWLKAAELQAPNGYLGAMGNNRLGNCTIAAKGHVRQVLTANSGTMVTAPDSLIIADYARVDGYVIGDPSTDNGGVMSVVNAAWMKPQGVAGFQMAKVIPIRYQLLDDIFKAVDRYGFCDCGIALPLSAQNQGVWVEDLSNPRAAEMGSWGGHDATIAAYDIDAGLVWFETWGLRQPASFDWVQGFVDEAYTGIAADPKLRVPNGYADADLAADLSVLS